MNVLFVFKTHFFKNKMLEAKTNSFYVEEFPSNALKTQQKSWLISEFIRSFKCFFFMLLNCRVNKDLAKWFLSNQPL